MIITGPKRIKSDWGFACLLEYGEQKLLFDAGRYAEFYGKNLDALETNPSVNCYLPSSCAAQLKARGTLPPGGKSISAPRHP